MNIKSQIKAQILLAGFTMAEAVDALSTDYGWSDSLSNFSAKLRRESLRYKDVLELADVLGYEIVWQKIAPDRLPQMWWQSRNDYLRRANRRTL